MNIITLIENWKEGSTPVASVRRKRHVRPKKGAHYEGSTSSFRFRLIPEEGKLSLTLTEFSTLDPLGLVDALLSLEEYFLSKASAYKHTWGLVRATETSKLQPLTTWGILVSMLAQRASKSLSLHHSSADLQLQVLMVLLQESRQGNIAVSPRCVVHFACESDEEMFEILQTVYAIASCVERVCK